MASSTSNRFGLTFLRKIAVARSSALQRYQYSRIHVQLLVPGTISDSPTVITMTIVENKFLMAENYTRKFFVKCKNRKWYLQHKSNSTYPFTFYGCCT